ncbi:hypothetical protein [Hyphobacterium sp.]|uniref:hypothetical protein n=1 Tax=Hyphobacterium sp. TaxID=2004662 RepID=UPI003BAD06E3
MKSSVLLIAAGLLLAGCSTLNWPPERDNEDLTAQDLHRGECRLARASDPAGPGEWVCENPRTGEIERQTNNPIYNDQ